MQQCSVWFALLAAIARRTQHGGPLAATATPTRRASVAAAAAQPTDRPADRCFGGLSCSARKLTFGSPSAVVERLPGGERRTRRATNFAAARLAAAAASHLNERTRRRRRNRCEPFRPPQPPLTWRHSARPGKRPGTSQRVPPNPSARAARHAHTHTRAQLRAATSPTRGRRHSAQPAARTYSLLRESGADARPALGRLRAAAGRSRANLLLAAEAAAAAEPAYLLPPVARWPPPRDKHLRAAADSLALLRNQFASSSSDDARRSHRSSSDCNAFSRASHR